MKDSQSGEASRPASAHGPGRAPSGIPLTVRLGEQEYAALVRIARHRDTSAATLVEQLVLHALSKTEVTPAAESHPARKHTTYEEATAGFRPDAPLRADPEPEPEPTG